MSDTTITIDLSRIDEKEFDAERPLRVAAIRAGKIIAQKTIVPAQEKKPRCLSVQLPLGAAEDGVAGAEIVVAPADDERNLWSKLSARKFVAKGGERKLDAALVISPNLYRWWRYCWFPKRYRVTGRVVRHVDSCVHPIAGARVELFDVDYCWWWYSQDQITSELTDANGFFDISFTWCVPLWCLFEIAPKPPIVIDPLLRDRLREALERRIPIKFPPPPPPPDPWAWERQLAELGVALPAARRLAPVRAELAARTAAFQAPAAPMPMQANAGAVLALSRTRKSAAELSIAASKLDAAEIFGPILRWPPCDTPCDWLPDIKIRVTQTQPSGTAVIYEDHYADIHFDQSTDLLNLTLDANASALYADDCHPNPILGNCMLLDAVGAIQIAPTSGSPLSGIYQPDVSPGVSYGVTPDRKQRLGYVVNYDRPWARTLSIYGRFGIAANVDYYQVQVAKWTDADLLAWDLDHTHVPPDSAFAPVAGDALTGFARSYLEESPLPLHWLTETFGPNTIAGIDNLWKTRERFEQEYENVHGGPPAPDFGGWYWHYFTETRLFDLKTDRMSNGHYTFRFVCYRQTGVDGLGNPILIPAPMGLTGGIGKRCSTNKPELLTLYLHDEEFVPTCNILSFKKNGVDTVDECAMVNLGPSDYLDVEYEASDAGGHLDHYNVTLQKGASSAALLSTLAGVTAISGSAPEGPDYGAAKVDLGSPAIVPHWFGGTWTKRIPYATFLAAGGSCAYNLRIQACDRHTDGFTTSCGLGYCDENRAFTILLSP
jgi:hypothetical protein